MSNAYRMVNLDKIHASYTGNIESVKWDGGILQNSMPCILGGLATGESELYNILYTGATGSLATTEVLLIAAPEVLYSDEKMDDDFYIATGNACRAYHLTVGDIFTLSNIASSITSTAATGDCIVPEVTGMCWIVTAQTAALAGWRLVAKVIEVGTIGYDEDTAVSVRVIHC